MRASHIFNPNQVSGNINDKQTNTLNLNFVPHTQPLLQELIPMNVKMPNNGRTKLEALYIYLNCVLVVLLFTQSGGSVRCKNGLQEFVLTALVQVCKVAAPFQLI